MTVSVAEWLGSVTCNLSPVMDSHPATDLTFDVRKLVVSDSCLRLVLTSKYGFLNGASV